MLGALCGVLGQASNSQFGPVRPTELPSGHIRASMVQATGPGCGPGTGVVLGQPRPRRVMRGRRRRRFFI